MTTKITRSNIASTGVAAGSYSAADITVNSSGQVTSASTSSIAASGGGGPKISGVVVTDNAWTTLDDTAVDVLGGYIKITGTGFNTGCLVYFNQTPASSVSFISSTELRVTTGALSAGTYVVYAINTDGGVAISVPGVTFSASPSWQTSSSLSDQYDGVAITLSLIASDATSYTLVSGSLPPGLSLNASTGVITGTVVGVTVDTTYTFTVRATDAQNQDSPRTFTVTITISDPHFSKTTLLLSGSAISANTVLRDSSTNNFNLTAYGDARASNFSPYGTGWSVYFDGTGDNLSIANNVVFQFGSGDFTVECWIYPTSTSGVQLFISKGNGSSLAGSEWDFRLSSGTLSFTAYGPGETSIDVSGGVPPLNQWSHVAAVRNSTTLISFLNGTQVATSSISTSSLNVTSTSVNLASNAGSSQNNYIGYLSNVRLVKGTALYTANFTPATTNLTSVANTSLLTCHTNRFLDSSTNNFAITRNGDARVVSFNPFGITNTGVTGSMYFDGTGDYLSAAYNSAFDLGSLDFTLEAWLYTSDSSSNFPSIVGRWQGSGTACWDLRPRSTERGNFLVFVYSTDGTTAAFVDSNGPALSDNAWHHVVAVRSGNNFALFVDGTRRNTANLSGVTIFNSASAPLNVGYDSWGTTYFTGYLSNVRVVKGTAVYDPTQTTLTVPTAPLTNIANTQLLTLQYKQSHNNHTFLDSSSNQFLITRNGNTTQGTFSPFSQTGWGNYFTNSTNRLQFTEITQGSTWTIECFFNITASGLNLLTYQAAGDYWFRVNTTAIEYSYTGNTRSFSFTATPGVWYHLALVNNAGTLSCYVNGSQVGTSQTGPTTSYVSGLAGYGSPNNFTGYVSNLRITNTAIVPPAGGPTAPLTAVTGTQILTCQSNRFIDTNTQLTPKTITVSGSPTVVAFSPFAPTAVYSPAVHGGSGYFDGNGDYLTASGNAAFAFGTGDFTVGAWIYPTAAQVVTVLSSNYNFSSGTGNWALYFGVGSAQTLYFNSSSGNKSSTVTTTIPLNAWTYVAYTRVGTTAKFFVNGSQLGADISDSFNYGGGTGTLYVGRQSDGTGQMVGYMSSIQVLKGTGYSTLPIPTAPLTAITNTSLLLNFTDAAILDSTGRNAIETVADAKSSSVITKFTGGSMYFDGTGDYLAIPANAFFNQNYSATNKFTIEFWFYQQSLAGAGTAATVISTYGGGGGADGWRIETSANAPANSLRWVSNGTDTACSATVELNTWIHFAFTYNGTTIKVFKNGVLGNTATTSWTNNPGRLFIGTANASLAFPITGYLSDLRITNAERYTANFTAPTVPHRLK